MPFGQYREELRAAEDAELSGAGEWGNAAA